MNSLIYPSYLLPCAERNANTTAFVTPDETISYGDHADRVLRLVAAMGERDGLGVRPTETFAVLSRPGAWYIALWHAALCGAGIVNAVNTRFSDAELVGVLRDSATVVAFVDDESLPTVKRIRDQVPTLRTVVGMGQDPADVGIGALVSGAAPSGPPSVRPDDLAVVNFTGGTTGAPVGVLYTQQSLVLNVLQNNLLLDFFSPGTSYLCALPMYHIGAAPMTLGMPVSGNPSVVLPQFEAGEVIRAIEEHQSTLTAMVPTMLSFVLDHPEFRPERLASLRRLAYGSAPMTPALLARLSDALPNVEIVTAYGTTETGPITLLGHREHRQGPERMATVGRPMPGVEVRVGPSPDEHQPSGSIGEIWVRTPSQMRGYLEPGDGLVIAEPSRQATETSPWHRTGDVGFFDADGYLTLADRAKDMIISGGENVYSLEVENAISAHPDVAQVAVFGLPDPVWGETVHAVVVPREGADVDSLGDAVIDTARSSIAGYKVPRSVQVRLEPFPLSAAGKILKRVLRDDATSTIENGAVHHAVVD